MARKRMIDPDFWTDEKLGTCTRDERLFFMGLISNADDEGRGRGNLKLLKATIFPYDDDIKVKDMEKMACSLMEKGMVYFYVVDGQDFYYLPNFLKHQTINKPTKSNIPEMPSDMSQVVLPEYYRGATGTLPPNRKEEKRKEEKLSEDKKQFADTVFLTEDEYQKLVSQYGEDATKRMIEILDNYKGSTGKKYKSDYKAILNWVVSRYQEEKRKQSPQPPLRPRSPARDPDRCETTGKPYEFFVSPVRLEALKAEPG